MTFIDNILFFETIFKNFNKMNDDLVCKNKITNNII